MADLEYDQTAPEDVEKDLKLEKSVQKEVLQPKMQHIVVTLADGRRGVFIGPELITRAELMLKPPRLVDVVFSEPRELPKTEEEQKPPLEVKVAEEVKPGDNLGEKA